VPAFKDDYCGYGGAATFCNRSYRRCKDLGNEANFHGHRFLPAMMKKKLYWGRGAPK
jgi:hypothetical protein